MEVVVTGGAGFIGANLVRALRISQLDTRVVVVDDLSTGTLANLVASSRGRDRRRGQAASRRSTARSPPRADGHAPGATAARGGSSRSATTTRADRTPSRRRPAGPTGWRSAAARTRAAPAHRAADGSSGRPVALHGGPTPRRCPSRRRPCPFCRSSPVHRSRWWHGSGCQGRSGRIHRPRWLWRRCRRRRGSRPSVARRARRRRPPPGAGRRSTARRCLDRAGLRSTRRRCREQAGSGHGCSLTRSGAHTVDHAVGAGACGAMRPVDSHAGAHGGHMRGGPNDPWRRPRPHRKWMRTGRETGPGEGRSARVCGPVARRVP